MYRYTFHEPILYLPNGDEADTDAEVRIATDELAARVTACRGRPIEVTRRRLAAEFDSLEDVRRFLNAFMWADGGASERILRVEDIDVESGEAVVTNASDRASKATIGTGLIELVECEALLTIREGVKVTEYRAPDGSSKMTTYMRTSEGKE